MNNGSNNEARLLSSLGMCVKAGKVIFGVPMLCEAMRKGRGGPLLVVEASDTSDNTHKRIEDKCAYYKVKHIRITARGDELAHALGKTGVIAAVGITDKNLGSLVEQNF